MQQIPSETIRGVGRFGGVMAVLLAVMVMAGAAVCRAADPCAVSACRLIDEPDEIVAVLDNGLTVIVREHHTAPVAAVRLVVKAGSIYDRPAGAGISHLVEHIVSGGATAERSEEDCRAFLAQMGGDHNAMTGKSTTCYYVTVPAEHVGATLDMVTGWVTDATLPREAFDREHGVVQRELEMNAALPIRQLYSMFDALRYRAHPAKDPIIGYGPILSQVTYEQMRQYFTLRYHPENMVLSVVGDLDAAAMFRMIEQRLSCWPRRSQLADVLPDEPPIVEPRRAVKVIDGMAGAAMMLVGFPSVDLLDEDLWPLDTLAAILGQGKSSRLYQRLREKEQLVLDVSVGNYTPEWGEGTFTIFCKLPAENIDRTLQAIWQEIETIQCEGVSQGELSRAGRQLQVDHVTGHQTAAQVADTMARDMLTTGDAHFSDHYVRRMQQVDSAAVSAMARYYLVPEKQLTAIVSPEPVKAAAEREAKKSAAQAIRKITLDNGLTVLIRQDPGVDLVSVQLYVLGGLLDETDADNGISSLMSQLSLKGTDKYSGQDLTLFFDRIGAEMAARAGNNTYYYQCQMLSDDLPAAMERFADIVLHPTFNADELEKERQASLAAIAQIDNAWHGQAERFFRSRFFVNSPYKRTELGTASAVSSLTARQVAAFHQAHTVAKRSVLAVFGNMQGDAVETLVRRYFDAMPAGTVRRDSVAAVPEPVAQSDRIVVEAGAKDGATIFIGFNGMRISDIHDRCAMDILTEIIGSNSGLLHETLRGQGLVYYAWAYNFVGVVDGYIGATAQCQAGDVDQVLTIMRGILADAAAGQISDQQVAHGRINRLNSEILSRQTNSGIAMQAALDELYGLGYDFSEGYVDRMMAVTPEDVRDVARRYLSTPATVTIITSEPDKVSGSEVP